jgi:hypothetical protein
VSKIINKLHPFAIFVSKLVAASIAWLTAKSLGINDGGGYLKELLSPALANPLYSALDIFTKICVYTLGAGALFAIPVLFFNFFKNKEWQMPKQPTNTEMIDALNNLTKAIKDDRRQRFVRRNNHKCNV